MCLTHLVLYFTLLLLIYKRGALSPKAKKWIKRTVIIIIIGFLVVSNIRFSESEKTMAQQLYMYFTCTVPLFDYWLEFEKATGVHTYGAVSLLGLLRLPCNILKMIGITFPTVILNSANEIAVNWDSFGLANYGNRAVAQCRDNQKNLNETFSNIVTLHIAFSFICCVVYILYVFFLANEKLYAGIQFAYVLSGLFDVS